jgi:hypothetical protein
MGLGTLNWLVLPIHPGTYQPKKGWKVETIFEKAMNHNFGHMLSQSLSLFFHKYAHKICIITLEHTHVGMGQN